MTRFHSIFLGTVVLALLSSGCDRKKVTQITEVTTGPSAVSGSSGSPPGGLIIDKVTISPHDPSIPLGTVNGACMASIQLNAHVDGHGGEVYQKALWSVSGGASITSDGLFTASSAGTYRVTAKAPQNYDVADTATVTVTGSCAGGGGGTPPSTPTLTQCRNRIDDDGDGKIDAADPGCHTDGNANNSASYNPDDDDERDVTTPGPSTPSPAAPIPSLTANPMSVVSGGSTNLQYGCLNSTSASASSSPSNSSWSGSLSGLSGSRTLTLTQATTFYLTCNGPGGSATISVTVTIVASACSISSIDYSPSGGTIHVGQIITLVSTAPTGCHPFWYLSDTSRAQVNGSEGTAVINGQQHTYGPQATLKGTFSGSPNTITVTVQSNIPSTTPFKTYTWTVIP